jgi:F-type H+-transporting ATPase subunit epsilon
MAELEVTIVSADEQVWAGSARMVVARTLLGEIGLLAGHTPVLGLLAAGEVRIHTSDGGRVTARADDGFISLQNDVVTIAARSVELLR